MATSGSSNGSIRRRLVERQLRATSKRLRLLREELHVLDEQYLYLAEDADDLHTRSVVSDSPLAGQEFRDARRHADATAGRRREVVDSIARLEGRQDELLDRLAR